MKRKIGLALAAGLAMLVAGCANQGGGEKFPAGPGQTGSDATRGGESTTSRNFNLAVKCPGVHWEKTHGWSNQQIMQQESLEEQDIPACEQWVQAQPKGYVPPPPPGTVPAKGTTGGGAGGPGGAPAPAPKS
jgi:hypothetical protein